MPPRVGGYAWRKAKGLLTIGDKVRRYQAISYPRGPYLAPLPGDLIECGRASK